MREQKKKAITWMFNMVWGLNVIQGSGLNLGVNEAFSKDYNVYGIKRKGY